MAMAKAIVLSSLQWLMYNINLLITSVVGYSFAFGWREEKLKASTHYESSAQILKIRFRAKKGDFHPHSLEQFLLFHSGYFHPNVVCRDNITLLTVRTEQAYFAVLPPEVDVYSSDISPFFYVTQFRFATHIVVLPIRSFHRLAEEIGDPRTQTVLLSNTGRCGSTLLAQIFEAIPNTIAISEPEAFVQPLQDHKMGKINDEQVGILLRSIVRLQCKSNNNKKEIDRIVIKTGSVGSQLIKKINTCCKYIKHVYMYRHPKQTICSFLSQLSMAGAQPVSREFMKSNLSIPDTSDYQLIPIDQILKGLSLYGFFTLDWVLNIACYIEYKHEGIDIYPIKYEDLLDDPERTTSDLFAFLDIPKQYTTKAVKALEKDSQRGSPLARKKLSKTKVREFSTQQLKEVNFVLQKSGFPTIKEFHDLPDKRQLKLKSFLTSCSPY